jgi:PAT family acetyl-CoA transporter-like MFS transporter 1
MTLLNTLANLGAKWPNSLALWLLSRLTQSACLLDSTGSIDPEFSFSNCIENKQVCASHSGQCKIMLDGYSVETFACITIGFLWLLLFRKTVLNLQNTAHSEWLVSSSTRSSPATYIPVVKSGKSRYE